MALRTVKGSALKRYAFYDDKLRQVMLEENAVLDEMNNALEQGQFVPYLQPIFNMYCISPYRKTNPRNRWIRRHWIICTRFPERQARR